MIVVVADTSPLRYLALIGEAEILVLDQAAAKGFRDLPAMVARLRATNFGASTGAAPTRPGLHPRAPKV